MARHNAFTSLWIAVSYSGMSRARATINFLTGAIDVNVLTAYFESSFASSDRLRW